MPEFYPDPEPDDDLDATSAQSLVLAKLLPATEQIIQLEETVVRLENDIMSLENEARSLSERISILEQGYWLLDRL